MIKINDFAKETLCVIRCFDENLIARIPTNLIIKLEEDSKMSDVNINIDVNKNLEEQPISEECKDFISLIYYNYLADDEEKKEILKIWEENEKKYQETFNKNIKF